MRFVLTICLMIYATFGRAISEENFLAFTKLYGYAKYFNPKPLHERVDWEHFVYFGLSELEQSSLRIDRAKLYDLYAPLLGSDISFSPGKSQSKYIMSGDLDKYFFSFNSGCIDAKRIHRLIDPSKKSSRKGLKEFLLKIDSLPNQISRSLVGDELYVTYQLVRSKNQAESTNDSEFLEKMEKAFSSQSELSDKYNDYFDLIEFYALIKHLYPYLSNSREDVDSLLLESSRKVNLNYDIEYVLRGFGSALNDGHFRVYDASTRANLKRGSLPIRVKKTPDNWVISNSSAELRDFHGFRIEQIDFEPIESYLDSLGQILSGSPQNKQSQIGFRMMNGRIGDSLVLSISNDVLDTNLVLTYSSFKEYELLFPFRDTDLIEEIKDKKYEYIDVSNVVCESMDSLFHNLIHSESNLGLVLDLRKYPKDCASKLLDYLNIGDTGFDWACQVAYVLPDQTSPIEICSHWQIESKKEVYTKPIFVLIGNRTMSYGESMCYYLNQVPNAKLIGQNTAGANGNTIPHHKLPSGIKVVLSNMLVYKEAGLIFDSTGYTPDIYIYAEKSMEIDPELEYVLESIR